MWWLHNLLVDAFCQHRIRVSTSACETVTIHSNILTSFFPFPSALKLLFQMMENVNARRTTIKRCPPLPSENILERGQKTLLPILLKPPQPEVVDQNQLYAYFSLSLTRFLHKPSTGFSFLWSPLFCYFFPSASSPKLILIIDNAANEISAYENHKFFIISFSADLSEISYCFSFLWSTYNFFRELMRFLGVR